MSKDIKVGDIKCGACLESLVRPRQPTDVSRSPLGLVPKDVCEEKRFYEVCSAISRYYSAGFKIPLEWVEEYNELLGP